MAETVVRIGVVLSSVREGRRGEAFARWIHGIVAERAAVEVELLDLQDWPFPRYAHRDTPNVAEKSFPPGASSGAGESSSPRSTAS